MVLMTDYPTLIVWLRTELADLLRLYASEKREKLLAFLAEKERSGAQTPQMSESKELARTLPPPKTTKLPEILGDENLERLQPQISQGLYTSFIPPDVALRLHCFVG